ncbi:MAG: amidohydrolase family protein, partial [Verrucomicrobiota bacterium]
PVSVANSKALEVSGITRATSNPTPGEIVRDANGEPTGLLRNAAHMLKSASSAFKPTADEQRAAVKKLHSLYNRQGITSIGERRTETEAIDLFRDLEKSGELTVRINCTRMMEPVPKTLDEALKKLDELTFGSSEREHRTSNPEHSTSNYGPTGVGDDWVRIGPLKVLLDGGMLIGTAYMREPWGVSDVYQINDPNYRGLLNVKPAILNPLYLEAARRGWQLAAHCTGEASPDVLLDCYENIHAQMDLRDRRFLVTHANFQFADSLKRFQSMGIAADVQPAWLYKDGASLRQTLGERRMQSFQPLKTCFDEGICIGGGSDHMVQLDSFDSTNPWNPWLGMWVAITRHTERGKVDKPEQRLSREQAIRLYTINNAFLNFDERKKGSLEPDKLADLILIDRNVLTCPVDEIKNTRVLLTMVGGKIVWQQDGK